MENNKVKVLIGVVVGIVVVGVIIYATSGSSCGSSGGVSVYSSTGDCTSIVNLQNLQADSVIDKDFRIPEPEKLGELGGNIDNSKLLNLQVNSVISNGFLQQLAGALDSKRRQNTQLIVPGTIIHLI